MTWDNWATVADLGTALGTLVLAVATFSSVRSGNRSARVAEQSLLTSLRPLLMPSRLNDPMLKVNFGDNKWVRLPGGSGVAEIGGGDGTRGPGDSVIYLSVSVRNVGNGLAVLHGWRLTAHQQWPPDEPAPPLSEFQMQTRDLWISPGDIGFWQGAIRDLADQRYPTARRVIENKSDWIVDLLYGDQDGGQRAITRFRCQAVPGWSTGHSGESPSAPGSGDSGSGHPDGDDGVWLATVVRHWTLDQPDPRSADRTA
ncbi:MAG TPA: hypothetical protein VN847_16505 [Streptosporangiaceae bacterium]|nr:hypothetical protein [Streptosporangiaceae bacterium]